MRQPRRYPIRSVSAHLSFVAAAAVVAGITAPNTYAQELDRVVLQNGNAVVGEIEDLRRGDLSVDTEEMSVVSIDWDDIDSVTSNRIFEVTDVTGFQYFGRLEATDQQGTLVVVLGEIADTLAFSEVVEMTYIGQGFFAKTKGYVDVGVNITRANSLASLLLKGRFAYRGRLWDFDYNAEAYFQRQETTTDFGDTFEEQTSRTSTSVGVKRFFGGSWAATTSVEVEQNEELSLDNRLLLILGGEYFLIRTQGMELSAGLGGALNNEEFTGEDRTSSREMAAAANFDAFDIGDFNISTSVSTFINPSEPRFRLNFDTRLSWEIFDDFVVGLNMTERYDSQPPTEDSGRDFNYGLTIGWNWG